MSKSLNIQTNDFDSWFDSVNLNMEFWESPVCAARFGYEAGQQSRQEEINNLVMSNHHLSMQLADSGNFYDYEKKRADELQNMVVKVLAELESIPYWDRSGNCETVIKLLKVAS